MATVFLGVVAAIFVTSIVAYEHDGVGKDLKQQQLYKSMQYEIATASNSDYTKHR